MTQKIDRLLESNKKKLKVLKDKRKFANDRLYSEYKEICNPAYKKWYMKCFYYIPEPEIHRFVAEALKSDNPNVVFSKKLKSVLTNYVLKAEQENKI